MRLLRVCDDECKANGRTITVKTETPRLVTRDPGIVNALESGKRIRVSLCWICVKWRYVSKAKEGGD